jgi:hypothetical protein
MSWINVVAVHEPSGTYVYSKRLLKKAMAERPHEILFIRVARFEIHKPAIRGSEIPVGYRLNVVGPTAYDRRWYGLVEVQDGKVRVS